MTTDAAPSATTTSDSTTLNAAPSELDAARSLLSQLDGATGEGDGAPDDDAAQEHTDSDAEPDANNPDPLRELSDEAIKAATDARVEAELAKRTSEAAAAKEAETKRRRREQGRESLRNNYQSRRDQLASGLNASGAQITLPDVQAMFDQHHRDAYNVAASDLQDVLDEKMRANLPEAEREKWTIQNFDSIEDAFTDYAKRVKDASKDGLYTEAQLQDKVASKVMEYVKKLLSAVEKDPDYLKTIAGSPRRGGGSPVAGDAVPRKEDGTIDTAAALARFERTPARR